MTGVNRTNVVNNSSQHTFDTVAQPTWCPGCGNFGIHKAIKNAFTQLGLAQNEIVVVTGIGCSGNTAQWYNTNVFHSLHGRTLPVATGIKLANHELTVLAEGGDGDGLGIGVGHLVHSIRRNLDITYIVHDNRVYGLTTGQTSPTSAKGFITKSTPTGVIEIPVNPIALAISSGATYVARGYCGDIEHLTKLIADGIRHKGFALIDATQICITFNHVNTYKWWADRIYRLEDDGGYDCMNKVMAFERSQEWEERIPTGLFYREDRTTYEDELPQIADRSLVEQSMDVDITELMGEYV